MDILKLKLWTTKMNSQNLLSILSYKQIDLSLFFTPFKELFHNIKGSYLLIHDELFPLHYFFVLEYFSM